MTGSLVTLSNHGYDNSDPSMHAIFVAHGPFANAVKAQSRSASLRSRQAAGSIASDGHTHVIPGFDNVEVYDLVAGLLRIPIEKRPQNNGTSGFWDQYIDFAALARD